jgi:hypothetical protein
MCRSAIDSLISTAERTCSLLHPLHKLEGKAGLPLASTTANGTTAADAGEDSVEAGNLF